MAVTYLVSCPGRHKLQHTSDVRALMRGDRWNSECCREARTLCQILR
jgi:hypothetical protein